MEELDAALSGVPKGERQMIMADVADHITSAISEHPDPVSAADVDEILAELGSPQAIVDEGVDASLGAPVAAGVERFASSRGYAALTVLLLAVGGLVVPVAGWMAGVLLLWISSGWPMRAKIVGSIFPFVGLPVVVFLLVNPALSSQVFTECATAIHGGPRSCTTEYTGAPIWLGPVILAVLLGIQIASAAYVYRKFRSV